jgi:hypothetical protein
MNRAPGATGGDAGASGFVTGVQCKAAVLHEALHRARITFVSREIHSATLRQSANNRFTVCGNDAGSVEMGMESNMIKKVLGAAAMAAVAYAVVPASAAKMEGCSGGNLSKAESMIEAMADGEGKLAAQKEVAQAQDALLNGKVGVCAVHLSKAMHVGAMK